MPDLRDYLATLRDLAASGAPFVIIGSCALELHGVTLAELGPKDCDIACDAARMAPLVEALAAAGWDLRVWGEPLRRPLDPAQVAGKFYVRATRGACSLDLDHELPIPFAAMWADHRDHAGLPLASLAHIVALKRLRASPRDLAQLARLAALVDVA